MIPTTPQYFAGNPENFKKVANEVCPGFVINELNKDILNEIYLYANNSGNLDCEKGICLWGENGTGKTTLLRILAEYQRSIGNGFKIINCITLSEIFEVNGYVALEESCRNSGKPIERGFDDLGREQIPTYHFNNVVNIMQYIIHNRYERRHLAKTHITTNLKIESIEKLYGRYIADRAREMFNFIELKGGSRRK